VGLASQKGNHVTISYRREDFVRLKEKNEARIKNMIASKKVTVIFNSQVTEIKQEAVTLLEGENVFHNLQNDHVFVFAGGELPAELLKRIGIQLRTAEVDVKAA
jgi:thioredoxin reductase